MGGQDEASTTFTTRSDILVLSVTIAVEHVYADDTVLVLQTVQAMQAILDDLTMDDHFAVIDFNHNVRCWREDLVAASPIQIGDAKNYIQNIRPSGGSADSS